MFLVLSLPVMDLNEKAWKLLIIDNNLLSGLALAELQNTKRACNPYISFPPRIFLHTPLDFRSFCTSKAAPSDLVFQSLRSFDDSSITVTELRFNISKISHEPLPRLERREVIYQILSPIFIGRCVR